MGNVNLRWLERTPSATIASTPVGSQYSVYTGVDSLLRIPQWMLDSLGDSLRRAYARFENRHLARGVTFRIMRARGFKRWTVAWYYQTVLSCVFELVPWTRLSPSGVLWCNLLSALRCADYLPFRDSREMLNVWYWLVKRATKWRKTWTNHETIAHSARVQSISFSLWLRGHYAWHRLAFKTVREGQPRVAYPFRVGPVVFRPSGFRQSNNLQKGIERWRM